MRSILLAIVCAACLGPSVGWGQVEAPAEPTEEPPPVAARRGDPAILHSRRKTAPPDADDLQRLQFERYNTAVAELQYCLRMREVGVRGMTTAKLLEPASRLLEAELDLSDLPADHVAPLERYLELAKYIEAGAKELLEEGAVEGSYDVVLAARARTLEVEVRLLKAKRKAAAAKKK